MLIKNIIVRVNVFIKIKDKMRQNNYKIKYMYKKT